MAEKQHEKHAPGQPDYGHNNPTGGTNENTGNLNPQGPTAGTENFHPDRKAESNPRHTKRQTSPTTPIETSMNGRRALKKALPRSATLEWAPSRPIPEIYRTKVVT